ncbi:MAG TPA: MazG nucleotide pyrophosphohydrolase domain-containing protein [Candidatus Binatia bacterium]|nr:MazG nucleotide pyrophosphohydrolase domain-containing protein [Candidatus Binatia bacterium]
MSRRTPGRSIGPLSEALRIQRAAAGQGFDWPDLAPLWRKLAEEIRELKAVAHDRRKARDELGDLLFMAVNLARHLQVDPSRALSQASRKFLRRYAFVMRGARTLPKRGDPRRLAAMERRWVEAKRREHRKRGR